MVVKALYAFSNTSTEELLKLLVMDTQKKINQRFREN